MRPALIFSNLLILCSLIFHPLVYAEPVVVDCTGKYVMGDLDSKKDAKILALTEAKRLALERAGTYLEGNSEVKNFELTKDQITTLTAGIMSVEVLKEDWQMSGENLMVTVLIRAKIDTSNLEERINNLKDDKSSVDDFQKMQAQFTDLKKELDALKAQRAAAPTADKMTYEKQHEAIIKQVTTLEDLERAKNDLGNKRYGEAAEGYARLIADHPDRPDLYVGQAIALRGLGRNNEAFRSVDTALRLVPDRADAYGVKARLLADGKEYQQALEVVNRAIKLNPHDPKYYLGRAELSLKLNRPRLAAYDFKTACKMGSSAACKRLKGLLETQRNQSAEYRKNLRTRNRSAP